MDKFIFWPLWTLPGLHTPPYINLTICIVCQEHCIHWKETYMHISGDKREGQSLYNKLQIDGKFNNLAQFHTLGVETSYFSCFPFNLFALFFCLEMGTICVTLRTMSTSRKCPHCRWHLSILVYDPAALSGCPLLCRQRCPCKPAWSLGTALAERCISSRRSMKQPAVWEVSAPGQTNLHKASVLVQVRCLTS